MVEQRGRARSNNGIRIPAEWEWLNLLDTNLCAELNVRGGFGSLNGIPASLQ